MKILDTKIISNFIWRALQMFGKEGVSFFFLILSVTYLSPWDFGLYNYIIAIVFFLIIFSDFGISTAASRYVAQSIELKDGAHKKLFFNATILISALSFIVFLILFLIELFIKPEIFNLAYIILPLIVLTPLSALLDGIYRGKKEFKKLTLITIVSGVISVLFGYFLVLYFDLLGALISQLLLYILFTSLCILSLRDIELVFDKSIIKEISGYSFVIGLSNVSFFLFSRINVLIIGYYGYIIEVGNFELVNKVILIMLLPYLVFAQVVSPEITALKSRKETNTLLKWYDTFILIAFLSSAVIAILVYVCVPLLTSINNPNLQNVELILLFKIMLISFVSQSMSIIASIGFSTSSGHAKLNLYFLLFFGLLNVLLSVYFTRSIGYLGAVYTGIIIKVVSDVIFVLFYRSIIKKQYE